MFDEQDVFNSRRLSERQLLKTMPKAAVSLTSYLGEGRSISNIWQQCPKSTTNESNRVSDHLELRVRRPMTDGLVRLVRVDRREKDKVRARLMYER